MTDNDIVKWVAEQFPPDFKGHALEIGACDGLYLSNTLVLEQAGWDVLCIEPNPSYFNKLKNNRKLCLNYACSDKNQDGMELEVHDREGVPVLGWEPGEPVSALKGKLSPKFIEQFCPDILPPVTYTVNVRTLDFCLEEVKFPKLDFLSLDVDGIELQILKGFNADRWGTEVIVVENPFSDPAIHEHLALEGFELIEVVHINELWKKMP